MGKKLCLFQNNLGSFFFFIRRISVFAQNLFNFQPQFCLYTFPVCPVDSAFFCFSQYYADLTPNTDGEFFDISVKNKKIVFVLPLPGL